MARPRKGSGCLLPEVRPATQSEEGSHGMSGSQASDKLPIPGGYYLKARKIQDSEIAHAPPHIREIWDWLLKEANHADAKIGDKVIKRGQCVRSYKDIQEGLSWHIGWRKKTYSKDDCETAMKWLTKHTMVTTQKTTRGMLVTVINYDLYQNPHNYENHTETGRKTTRKPQTRHTINKNEKNEKNETYVASFAHFWENYPPRNGKKLEQPQTFTLYCLLSLEELPLVNQAARNYAQSELVKRGVGIKDPKRFLRDGNGNGYWREWIEPERADGNNGGGRITALGGLAY